MYLEKSWTSCFFVYQLILFAFAGGVSPFYRGAYARFGISGAHFLSERRVLIPELYQPMWYLGVRVSLHHSAIVRVVPLDPPESMMLSTPAAGQAYRTALHRVGADSLCLPWRDFVDREANYKDFLLRLAPAVHFVCI